MNCSLVYVYICHVQEMEREREREIYVYIQMYGTLRGTELDGQSEHCREKGRENERDSPSRFRLRCQEDVLVDDVGGDGRACILVKEDLDICRGSAPGKGDAKLAAKGEDWVSEVDANVLD